MILASLGSPSAISYAVASIMRQALEGCVGAHDVFHVVRLDDLAAQWRRDGERRPALVVSDCPHVDVMGLVSAAAGPILVSCDSFDHIVDYVMRSRGMAFAPAVRFATQVVSALDVVARAANVLRITPDHYGRALRSLAATLTSFTGLACPAPRFDALVDRLTAGGGARDETFRAYVERHFPHAADPGDLALADGDRLSLETLVASYEPLVEGRRPPEIAWPAALFLDWDRPGCFLSGAVDLLGPARFIVCGPYLHLPMGHWRMTAEIETRDCLSDNRLGADVFSGRILAAVTMRLPPRGRFAFDVAFEVTDPLLPVELRLQLLTGAIEGSLQLLGVRVAREASNDNRTCGEGDTARRADAMGWR